MMRESRTQLDVTQLLPSRKGHFVLESGHHGELWLDLELLCLHPEPVQRLAAELANRLRALGVEAVCGPLVEGAFVALGAAAELGVPFTYAERIAAPAATGLFPVRYHVPRALRTAVRGRRVAIVNDVINAGSSVRGTFADLMACAAQPVAIGTLAVLGDAAAGFATEHGLTLAALATLPNRIWMPVDCPLCAAGVPLSDPDQERGPS